MNPCIFTITCARAWFVHSGLEWSRHPFTITTINAPGYSHNISAQMHNHHPDAVAYIVVLAAHTPTPITATPYWDPATHRAAANAARAQVLDLSKRH